MRTFAMAELPARIQSIIEERQDAWLALERRSRVRRAVALIRSQRVDRKAEIAIESFGRPSESGRSIDLLERALDDSGSEALA